MAEGRDFSQELFGPGSPAAPEPAESGRDFTKELFSDTVHDRVMQKSREIIGTQRTLLGDVPVRKPLTMEELRARSGEWPAAQRPEGVGPLVGEIAGGTIGSVVAPGVGTIAGGAAGAGLGQAVEDWILIGEVDPKRAAVEAGLSLLPEVAETALRAGVRSVLRSSAGGKIIRFAEAARRAREMPGAVFDPPEKRQVAQLFEQVRQSGVKIDTSPVRGHVQGLTSGKYDELLSEVKRIDRGLKTGGRFEALVKNLRGQGTGPQVAGWDIGDLQTLRSEVRKRKEAVKPVEAKQLLEDFQDEVDDAIDFGLAKGRVPAGDVPQVLQEARRGWARLRSAEEMTDAIERSITSTPDLSVQTFNLRQFFDNIRRKAGRQAEQINRALDLTPGGRARFEADIDNISELYKTIEMPLTDVAGFRRSFVIGGLGQMLSRIMSSDVGRKLFSEAVIYGRGRVSPNLMAAIASYARREMMGQDVPFMEATEESQ